MSSTVQLFEHSLALPFFGIGMKTDLFQSCGHCWVFQICWHIECSTFTASSFRIWNSSPRIPSPPLALFVVMVPKGLWCWEGLGAGGEGDNRGWDGWMASSTRWTGVSVGSGSWWWTGRPGVLQSMGSQRVGHNWATELNWTDTHLNAEFQRLARRDKKAFLRDQWKELEENNRMGKKD